MIFNENPVNYYNIAQKNKIFSCLDGLTYQELFLDTIRI